MLLWVCQVSELALTSWIPLFFWLAPLLGRWRFRAGPSGWPWSAGHIFALVGVLGLARLDDLDQLINIIVPDGVFGLARLDDLDQLIHIIVVDGVSGLARLDDLDQLIHIIVLDSAATGVHNHSLKSKQMSNQKDLHGNT